MLAAWQNTQQSHCLPYLQPCTNPDQMPQGFLDHSEYRAKALLYESPETTVTGKRHVRGPASLGPRNRSAVPGRSKLPTIIRSWQIDIRSGRHPDSLVSVDDFHLAILDAMLASSPTYIKYRRMQGQINVSHCFSTALCHHINIEDSAFQSIHVFA